MNIDKNQIESIRKSFADKSGCCTKQAMKQWLNPNVPDGPPPAECCGLVVDNHTECGYERNVLTHNVPLSNLDCCTTLEITSSTGGDCTIELSVTVGFNTYTFSANDTQQIFVCPHNNLVISYELITASENVSTALTFTNLDCPNEEFSDAVIFNGNYCGTFNNLIGFPTNIQETITYVDPFQGCLPNDVWQSDTYTVPNDTCQFTLQVIRGTELDCGTYKIYVNGVPQNILYDSQLDIIINEGDTIYFTAEACDPPQTGTVIINLKSRECNEVFTVMEFSICP